MINFRKYINKPSLSFKPNFGNLRTLKPISNQFGYDRGTPIDRYYIEHFLYENSNHIVGNVVEVGDNSYSMQFQSEALTEAHVIHINDPAATYVTDLATDKLLPIDHYNCAVITQTLHCIFDCQSALKNLHKTLTPNGVLLLTVPGISQLSSDTWSETWSWSFTKYSLLKLAIDSGFSESKCTVNSHGNVLTSSAFLYGLAMEDLTKTELEHVDDRFQQLITLVAIK